MKKRRSTTIFQIAQEAGVSVPTVSRVLDGRPDVAIETRQRVQEVIDRFNFQPSAAARSLVSHSTRILGLIANEFEEPSLGLMIAGAQAEAHRQGYFLILGSNDRDEDNAPGYLRLLQQRQVEGLVFFYPVPEAGALEFIDIVHKEIPVVTAAYRFPDSKIPVVDHDNVDGGRQAMQCLLDNGHRDIVMITGPLVWKAATDRMYGGRLALEAAGLGIDPERFVEGDWSYQSGYEATRTFLVRNVPFSALFAHNDRMAIGAIQALHDSSLRVPQDVSVVGFDDIPGAVYNVPPLTTVRQSSYGMGSAALQLLIQIVQHPETHVEDIILKTELVVRQSSGPRT